MRKLLKKLQNHIRGTTTVEMALMAPIIFAFLFASFAMGSYVFGQHQAQRTIEKTARDIRFIDEPTQQDIEAVLSANLNKPIFGSYQTQVKILKKPNGNFAELKIAYSMTYQAPFMKTWTMQNDSVTQIPLRELPL